MKRITSATVLDLVACYLPKNPVIVEAGSFIGTDTQRLSQYWPEGTVHAFEPVPEIFNKLASNTQHCANVYRYPLALASKTGTQPFYMAYHPKKPTAVCPAGSLLVPKDRLLHSPIRYQETIPVATITLADWALQHQITKIDFMWLDLQGNEQAVLQSGKELLASTRALYIEMHFIEAYHQQPSYQTVDTWLKEQFFEPVARDFDETNRWFFGNVLYINTAFEKKF